MIPLFISHVFVMEKIFQVYRSTDFMRYNTLKIQLRQLNDG